MFYYSSFSKIIYNLNLFIYFKKSDMKNILQINRVYIVTEHIKSKWLVIVS